MVFPPLQTLEAWAAEAGVRVPVRPDFALGLDYYLRRLDRLMFAGDTVLDAASGAGQWSLALAQRFRSVTALQPDSQRLDFLRKVADRMGITNIVATQGTSDCLSFPDQAFDAVYCHGETLPTNLRASLAEFLRVLKLGGRIYLCLRADGWWHHLIQERGSAEPELARMGRDVLYSTFFRRALSQGLATTLRRYRRLEPLLRCLAPLLRSRGVQRGVARLLLEPTSVGRDLYCAVLNGCGPSHLARLGSNSLELLRGGNAMDPDDSERAYLPTEFEELARAAGFAEFQWYHEGGLVCDWRLPAAPAMYPSHHAGQLAVWECLMIRPEPLELPVSVERHLEAARQAWREPVFVENSRHTVLGSPGSGFFPRPLLELARWQAEAHGGAAYFRRLAAQLISAARNSEEAVRAIVRFVQDALFRDPVAQPLTESGECPDAATILFCARGRCGHAAKLVTGLCAAAGLQARLRQFPQHLIAEVEVDGRWVVADADAYKNGIIPTNRQGMLLSLEDLETNPFQLDRFPPTGWFLRPDTRFTAGARGFQVRGYVDALEPEQRGYVSGYYVERAKGAPPSLPGDLRFEVFKHTFRLTWTAARSEFDGLLGYRVAVGSRSRGWNCHEPVNADLVMRPIAADILGAETTATVIEGEIPSHAQCLYASITPFTTRIEKEPDTYFQPSEELRCPL